jgi:hypothetical protein
MSPQTPTACCSVRDGFVCTNSQLRDRMAATRHSQGFIFIPGKTRGYRGCGRQPMKSMVDRLFTLSSSSQACQCASLPPRLGDGDVGSGCILRRGSGMFPVRTCCVLNNHVADCGNAWKADGLSVFVPLHGANAQFVTIGHDVIAGNLCLPGCPSHTFEMPVR